MPFAFKELPINCQFTGPYGLMTKVSETVASYTNGREPMRQGAIVWINNLSTLRSLIRGAQS